MPIHVPGKRNRRGKISAAKRGVVAVLSLTAMVDMFTVLAVFLLQNYAVTGEVLYLADDVRLPEARAVKELKPANVVVVTGNGISFNENKVADVLEVKEQKEWLIASLRDTLVAFIAEKEKEKVSIKARIKEAVNKNRNQPEADDIDGFRRITIQADKKMDFLTVKKVMYTVTESGVYEINFAVIKRPDTETATN